jgi:hypothetical protein
MSIYLGRWCQDGDTALRVMTEKEWNECRDGDGYIEIRRDGYSMHEQECRYVSIKHTGEKWPTSTKPRKEDWIPVNRRSMARFAGTQ